MEKMLKKDLLLFKRLLKLIFPKLYVNIKEREKRVIIKKKWYSFKNTTYSFEEILTDIIPKTFATVHIDRRKAFEDYIKLIDFHKNGMGCLPFLISEYWQLKPAREETEKLLKDSTKLIDGTIWLERLSQPFTSWLKEEQQNRSRRKTKKLELSKESQLIIPYSYIEEGNLEIVATIFTGNKEIDKEFEKILRIKAEYF